jgi:spore photoproduct lyase
MMDWAGFFEEVVIEEAACGTPLAERVLSRFPADRVRVVPDVDEEKPGVARSLVVAVQKGAFLRRCPGTPGMLCCNLHVLDLVEGCPFDCTYCFLHSYQNTPGIRVYANYANVVGEVGAFLKKGSPFPLRITTGELGDSLALEDLTGMAEGLVPLFGKLPGAVLELKTKSTAVAPLLDLDHGGRVVISWSLSPVVVAEGEERGAPPVGARLDAARQACLAGYGIAFHFDPVFLFDGWEDHYTSLIAKIFETVPGEAVRWFSLGGFRYPPALKRRISERFPGIRIFLDEFLPCSDGKMRYFAPRRVAMYRILREAIETHAPRVPVYCCMEAAHIWRKAFGTLPGACRKLDPIYRPYP